ncbi:MAG: immunoglobulin-like domain-containing protein, partial [Sarcina sp.]
DVNTEGKYVLVYYVIDNDGNKTTESRSITVRTNNKPNLIGVEDVVIKLGDDFDKFIGIEATDYEDGEINHLIKVDGDIDIKSIGTYNLLYSVIDSDGNTIEVNRVITVRSNDKPSIVGADNKIIKVGDVFNERDGVIANDTEDKDLTNSIIIKGDVDVTKVGKYVLDYLVDDSDGNKTIKTRVITVRSNDKPIIAGADDTTIKLGDVFDAIEGVIVTDTEDGDITDILDIEGDVDTSKVGVYNLVYSLTDEDGNELRKTREITVRSNDKPVILGTNQLTIKVGDDFDKLKGVSANDTEDGDITNKIYVEGDIDSSKAESYTLFYSVIDSDGNKVKVKRRIIVKTNTKPVIDIDDTTIKIGENLDYKEGVVATDTEDGDLTKAIKVYGDVDNSKAGVYDLTYSVTDKDGNTTTYVRKVTVKTNDIPIIEGVNDITIKEKEYFNPMFGVSVTDTEDGDLTKELIINGNIDINSAGKYNLVYSIIDSDGNLVNKTRTIFVRTNNKPIIKGAINTKIKVGDTFDKLKGVTAIDTEDDDLTGKITVLGDLDTTKAGSYELVYSVIDSDGNEGILKRQVRVRTNEQPTIEGVEDIIIKVGENFDLKKDVIAVDTEDGDLTSKISISGNVDVNTEGIYNIDYSVKDKDNNETIVTRVVTVKTNTKPVIKGVEDITVKLGDIFQRTAGVTAIDKEDGPITN